MRFVKGSAAVAWPFAAMPVIGFLHHAFAGCDRGCRRRISRKVKEAGFTDGQSMRIEYRWTIR
jgi:hypothetical protein